MWVFFFPPLKSLLEKEKKKNVIEKKYGSFYFTVVIVEYFIHWLLRLDVLQMMADFEVELDHFYRPDLGGAELLL